MSVRFLLFSNLDLSQLNLFILFLVACCVVKLILFQMNAILWNKNEHKYLEIFLSGFQSPYFDSLISAICRFIKNLKAGSHWYTRALKYLINRKFFKGF